MRDCTARLQNTDGFYRERLHCEGFLWQVALFGRNLNGMKKGFYPKFMECFIPQPARDILRWARELPCLCLWLPKTHFQLPTLMSTSPGEAQSQTLRVAQSHSQEAVKRQLWNELPKPVPEEGFALCLEAAQGRSSDKTLSGCILNKASSAPVTVNEISNYLHHAPSNYLR